MDVKIIAPVFAAVFLAEFGDKTQLAILAFAGAESSRWSVFAGSAAALVTASAIATLAGAVVYQYAPAWVVRKAAGVLFLVFGLFYLVRG